MLIDWALDAGFDRAGVARLDPLSRGGQFIDWLARGRQAEMGYLARRVEARIDPRNVLDGAKSALCVALHYEERTAAGRSSLNDLWRGVARYAHGPDYHGVMGKMLEDLSRRIETEFVGSRTRWYVDTGPVLERELAAAAGIGVVGKNTCLLHPDRGSYFFLGEIFTTLELAPDAEIEDICGTCSRCLEACPTGALPAPFELDASRCISYWTIEHRGEIPENVRESLGEWVFGCDVCQEVCPVNEARTPGAPGAGMSPESEVPPIQRQHLDLVALASISREMYAQLFRGSPMKRAKREGLRRNAILAMGNSAEEKYSAALGALLDDENQSIRRDASWAIGRTGGAEALHSLTARLRRETSDTVRLTIRAAIEEIEQIS